MNQRELKELIDYLIDKDITEFELERGDVKVRIKRGAAQVPATEPQYVAVRAVESASAAAPAVLPQGVPAVSPAVEQAVPAPPPPAEQAGAQVIKSPIVGTFYASASPGAPPFVKVGDVVEAGQVLCIIEAMKLMNEIEADVAGEIVEQKVRNAEPVEYGQPLFTIRVRN